MTPGTYNFAPHYGGDTFNGVQFTLTRDGATENLLGTTAIFTLGHPDQRRVMVDLRSPDDISVSGNKITVLPFVLPRGVGRFPYDLTIIYPGGERKTYLRGVIPLIEDAS